MASGRSLRCITSRKKTGVVITPMGRITDMSVENFSDALQSEVDKGLGEVVLDMSNVDYIGSAGLREIMKADKRMKSSSRDFALCNVRDHLREVLSFSGFTDILTVREDSSLEIEDDSEQTLTI